ncbi:hypothetical protein DSM104299_03195 [Baekduia alba]|uniref:hypothetical protein n=1 Tax=Baekduia alba TaxID=2997333 RepID=UPI0023406FE8|nr:hypothetical protein [Baekduia alba]WCB94458.1 hypothetical protein DSM104299_03195 [Baekduia alba]
MSTVEAKRAGKICRYRNFEVRPDSYFVVGGDPTPRRELAGSGSSTSNEGEKAAPVFEEPEDFAQWLGRHCRLAKVEVPRAGTPRRRLLARVFAALAETGHDVAVLVRGLEAGEPERALASAWGFLVAEFQEEQRREEDGPSDDEIYNGFGVEGGIPYDTRGDARDEHDPTL